jgi:hypothetical protein
MALGLLIRFPGAINRKEFDEVKKKRLKIQTM